MDMTTILVIVVIVLLLGRRWLVRPWTLVLTLISTVDI